MMTDSEAPQQEATSSVWSIVASISGLMRHPGMLTTGDLASLRRMDPFAPAAAFFKIEGAILDEVLASGPLREEQENRWAGVVVGLALLGDLDAPGHRLGTGLAQAGYSEMRFARLLRADGDALVSELPTLARFVVAKGQPVDWSGAAYLILSAGRSDEESVRRSLARDYFREAARKDRA